MNVVYGLGLLLAALVAGNLAPAEWEEVHLTGGKLQKFPRYQACQLNGTENALNVEDTCVPFSGDSYKVNDKGDGYNFVPVVQDEFMADTQQVLYNISVAAAVINALLFVHSALSHWQWAPLVNAHLNVRPALSLINIGLFAGLVGWFNSVEHIDEDYNLDNNVYFSEGLNPITVAVVGLVLSVIDILASNVAVYALCKADECWKKD